MLITLQFIMIVQRTFQTLGIHPGFISFTFDSLVRIVYEHGFMSSDEICSYVIVYVIASSHTGVTLLSRQYLAKTVFYFSFFLALLCSLKLSSKLLLELLYIFFSIELFVGNLI